MFSTLLLVIIVVGLPAVAACLLLRGTSGEPPEHRGHGMGWDPASDNELTKNIDAWRKGL